MNSDHLVYVPQRAKVIIVTLGIIAFLISLALVFFAIAKGVDGGIVSPALALAQTCAAGLSVIALIFYTRFSVNVAFLRERTSLFFTKELPEAMSIIEYKDEGFSDFNVNYQASSILTNVRIRIKYNKGVHFCQYVFECYGSEQRVHVQVNVKRMAVYYFLDASPEELESVRSRLAHVVNGAVAAGYAFSFEVVDDMAAKNQTVQLQLFRTLSDEFLMNSSERLYIANDFASMTRALIRTNLKVA